MKALVAIDRNRAIGKGNGMLFHLPTDLAHFKKHTIGKTVLMGRKTLLSMPKSKPLPGRNNIVLSRTMEKTEEELKDGWKYVVRNSVEEVRDYLMENGLWDETVLSGGAEIYRLFLDDCDELIVTEIEAEAEGAESYFPEFKDKFILTEEDGPYTDGQLQYFIRTYKKHA